MHFLLIGLKLNEAVLPQDNPCQRLPISSAWRQSILPGHGAFAVIRTGRWPEVDYGSVGQPSSRR